MPTSKKLFYTIHFAASDEIAAKFLSNVLLIEELFELAVLIKILLVPKGISRLRKKSLSITFLSKHSTTYVLPMALFKSREEASILFGTKCMGAST